MVGLSESTRASVTWQMNMPWVSRSTYCSTFRLMNAFMYLGRNTRPLSLLKMSPFSFCNEARIRALADNGKAGAKRLTKLLDDFDRTIVTLLIVINICYILISAVATVAAVKLMSSDAGGAVATVAATLIVFMFCETIPKNIARVNADGWALFAAYPVSLFKFILAPLSALFTYVGEAFKKLLPGGEALPDVTEDEFEEMVESVEDEGLIEPVEKEIIKSTIHFGDILAAGYSRPMTGRWTSGGT